MPEDSNAKKEENSQSSKNIEIPAIPKQTAGAVAGAAIGSVAGPIGAVVGGVVGAVAAKAVAKRRPVRKATRGVAAVSKPGLKRYPTKKSRSVSRKTDARSRVKTGKTRYKQSPTAQSRKRMARGARARHHRRSGRTKRR